MKMTFQPKKRQRSKVHGFRSRMSTAGGRKFLLQEEAKGRKNYQLIPQQCTFSSRGNDENSLKRIMIFRMFITMENQKQISI